MVDSEDYQVGVHDIDTTGTIADESDVVEFEMETETVFKRLADDIYESAEAGIREPLMNAITSVRRAFDGSTGEGVIQITVKRGKQPTLRIRDNGLGITNDILENVLTVIGRSGVRDDGKLAGQYGMGFLASYKLVGPDGGFLMHTNPREGDEYKGMFRPGAFEKDTENRFPDLLGGGENGTAFEYHVKDSVSCENIRNWVEKHAEWSPVPLIYKELDEDGDEIFNEDYGHQSLSERYNTWLSVENEYFEAVASPSASGDIVLISSPMGMGDKNSLWNYLPWKVDLRLKYENGVVTDGPHEGLAPVTKEEYNSMSEERKDRYMPEKQLSPNDIRLPQPIGTREKLDSDMDFIRHVRECLNEEIRGNLSEIVENFDPESDDYSELDSNKTGSLSAISDAYDKESLRKFVSKYGKTVSNKDNLADKINDITDDRLSVDKDDDIVDFVARTSNEVKRVHPDEEKMLLSTLARSSNYQKTFVCVSSSTWKCDAVIKSSKDIRIVKVPKSDWYDRTEKYFGWEPLKNLNKSRVQSELGLTESEIDDIRDTKSSNNSPKEKTVKVRMGKNDSESYKAEKVKEMCNGNSPDFRNSEYLVLFPRGYDRNVSDNRRVADQSVSIASCSSDVNEYLSEDCDNIMDYKEFESMATSREIDSSEGDIQIGDLSEYEHVVVCFKSDHSTSLNWDKVLEFLCENIASDSDKFTEDELIVTAISPDDLTYLSPICELCDIIESITSVGYSSRRYHSYSTTGRKRRIDLLRTYAESKFQGITNSEEMLEIVNTKFDELNSRSMDFVDTISEINESTDSEDEDELDDNLPQHQTADGPMTISEIYSRYGASNVLVHVINPDYMDMFQSKKFIRDANKNLAGKRIATDHIRVNTDVFYVPIVTSVFSQIQDRIKNNTTIIGNTGRQRATYGSSKEDWFNLCFYADVKLHNWPNNKLSDLTYGIQFDQGIKLVDRLKVLHDEGGEPPEVPRTSNMNKKSSHIDIM